MSGSVQKTIPEEKILCIERELPARKNRRRFFKNLRRLKKPGVKQPVAVAVVGQLPEAAESAAASWRGADFVLIFLFCLLLIFVHELIHGITWAVFAKKGRKAISFGFNPQYLSPYCTCNEPLKKGKYITGALMPTLLLGLLTAAGAIVTGSAVLFCISAVMIFAGGGDLTIVLKLLRYKTESSEVLYLDHPYQAGLVVFLRP